MGKKLFLLFKIIISILFVYLYLKYDISSFYTSDDLFCYIKPILDAINLTTFIEFHLNIYNITLFAGLTYFIFSILKYIKRIPKTDYYQNGKMLGLYLLFFPTLLISFLNTYLVKNKSRFISFFEHIMIFYIILIPFSVDFIMFFIFLISFLILIKEFLFYCIIKTKELILICSIIIDFCKESNHLYKNLKGKLQPNNTKKNIPKDYLNRNRIKINIKNYIKDLFELDGKNGTIGVFGERGSGKTFLLNILSDELKKENKNYVIVNFEPFIYLQEEKMLEEFFKLLTREVKKKCDDERLNDLSQKFINSFLEAKSINVKTDFVKIFFNTFYKNKSHKEIKKDFEDVLTERELKVVVTVDDLDRCDSKMLFHFIRMMNVITNFKNVVYVVFTDSNETFRKIQKITEEETEEKLIEKQIYKQIETQNNDDKPLKTTSTEDIKEHFIKKDVKEKETFLTRFFDLKIYLPDFKSQIKDYIINKHKNIINCIYFDISPIIKNTNENSNNYPLVLKKYSENINNQHNTISLKTYLRENYKEIYLFDDICNKLYLETQSSISKYFDDFLIDILPNFETILTTPRMVDLVIKQYLNDSECFTNENFIIYSEDLLLMTILKVHFPDFYIYIGNNITTVLNKDTLKFQNDTQKYPKNIVEIIKYIKIINPYNHIKYSLSSMINLKIYYFIKNELITLKNILERHNHNKINELDEDGFEKFYSEITQEISKNIEDAKHLEETKVDLLEIVLNSLNHPEYIFKLDLKYIHKDEFSYIIKFTYNNFDRLKKIHYIIDFFEFINIYNLHNSIDLVLSLIEFIKDYDSKFEYLLKNKELLKNLMSYDPLNPSNVINTNLKKYLTDNIKDKEKIKPIIEAMKEINGDTLSLFYNETEAKFISDEKNIIIEYFVEIVNSNKYYLMNEEEHFAIRKILSVFNLNDINIFEKIEIANNNSLFNFIMNQIKNVLGSYSNLFVHLISQEMKDRNSLKKELFNIVLSEVKIRNYLDSKIIAKLDIFFIPYEDYLEKNLEDIVGYLWKYLKPKIKKYFMGKILDKKYDNKEDKLNNMSFFILSIKTKNEFKSVLDSENYDEYDNDLLKKLQTFYDENKTNQIYQPHFNNLDLLLKSYT